MALTFEQQINLTECVDNPAPKIVQQLIIIHEARDGELVQYYIAANGIEGDKNTHAIGIAVLNEYGQIDHYDYTDYTEVEWNEPAARITRQKIDRLSVKAFPGVGAIAAYKLAYRSISQIVAPVNYAPERQAAPKLAAIISADQKSITFTLTDPTQRDASGNLITYVCYRIVMVLDYHQLEYITYEKQITVTDLPVSGTYICYAIGYINEGEICSYNSDSVAANLVGIYNTWPEVSPGYRLSYTLSRYMQNIRLTASTGNHTDASIDATDLVLTLVAANWDENNQQTISNSIIQASSIVDILPILVTNQSDVINNELLKNSAIYESNHVNGEITFFAGTIPTNDVQVRVRLR